MKIEISGEAEDDLLAGYRFYEDLEPGVGSYFLDTLMSDIDSLLLFAGVHQEVSSFYRLLSKRFPFPIYYRYEQDVVRVYAVLDNRQAPSSAIARLAP